jgi:hypothetical protein
MKNHLDLKKNYLHHLSRDSPRKRIWNFKPLSLKKNPRGQYQGFPFQSMPGRLSEAKDP